MKRITFFLLVQLLHAACALAAGTAPATVYVSEFSMTGAVNKEEMRPALQVLLQSRLSGDALQPVENKAAADVVVTGNYIVFGKIFSLDAVAKSRDGRTLGRAFVQGDGQEDLIPAVGKLAATLSSEITRNRTPGVTAPPAVLPPAAATQQAAPAPTVSSDFIRPEVSNASSGWVSQRITGAMSSIALGRTLDDGSQEVYVGGGTTLQYYRRGKLLQLVAEATIDSGGKILGVDTADLDKDGIPEAYVTIRNGRLLESAVYVPGEKTLKRTGSKLPYFMRGIAVGGKEKKIYVQQVDVDDNFYGDVHELALKNGTYVMQNPLKLPKGGSIFNFSGFYDAGGKLHFVMLNPAGYLIVCSADGQELWRSSDKFGGSELFYERTGPTDAFAKNVFIDQRIVVTGQGEVIVPQNSGFWVIGNNRSYNKHSIFAFAWNGVSLEEKWHTRQSQNYLADYAYDPAGHKLVLLEVVKKEGLIDKGASAVVVKPIDPK